MHESIATRLHRERGRLRASVRASNPRACPGYIEDAVSDAVLLALVDPDRFARALTRDGAPGLHRFAACVARRSLRDRMQRLAYTREVGAAVGDPAGSCGPGQEVVAALPRDIEAHLRHAAGSVHAREETRLTDALLDKLASGDGDAAVASRHGLRREYVNRAWRAAVDAWID